MVTVCFTRARCKGDPAGLRSPRSRGRPLAGRHHAPRDCRRRVVGCLSCSARPALAALTLGSSDAMRSRCQTAHLVPGHAHVLSRSDLEALTNFLVGNLWDWHMKCWRSLVARLWLKRQLLFLAP